MSQTRPPELRIRVDTLLDTLIQKFYDEVPFAQHQLCGQELHLEYYKRHNIETILRIRMKRTIDALAIRYFTKHDPVRAKAWSTYTADEMLHDTFFVQDLEKVGASREEIYSQEPLFTTKLLMGYLLYGLEYEGSPLALVSSVYFVEYTTAKTQPLWLDNLAKLLGEEKVKGARAHVHTDLDDDHADFVWEVLISLVKTSEDEAKVFDHIKNVYRLYEAYFTELYQRVVERKTEQRLELKTALVV